MPATQGLKKFDRNYVMKITTQNNTTITITRPTTLEFNIQRNDFAGTNVGMFSIYNLGAATRNLIRHDVNSTGLFDILSIKLFAGYGNGPLYPLIFSGNAQRAYSHREGTEFLTTIEAFDGGTAHNNALSDFTVPANTSNADVVNMLLADLVPYGVNVGAVVPLPGTVPKRTQFSDNTTALLQQVTNGNFFIDLETANVLLPQSAIGLQPIVTIDSSTGLLSTPYVEQQLLQFDILFEPRLVVGSTINLQSLTAQPYNGIHRITGIKHRGTISSAVSGDCVTTITARGGIFEGTTTQASI